MPTLQAQGSLNGVPTVMLEGDRASLDLVLAVGFRNQPPVELLMQLDGLPIQEGPPLRFLWPKPQQRVLLRTHLNDATGYGQFAGNLVAELINLGVEVAVTPIEPTAIWEEFAPLAPQVKQRLVENPSDAWEFVIGLPNSPLDPTKASVIFTMWEATRIRRAWAQQLNRAAAVITASNFNLTCFSAAGVEAPLFRVPLGINPAHFYRPQRPELKARPAKFVFGTGGRLAHGGVRKGVEEVARAFREAFSGKRDVELQIKMWPDCKFEHPGDNRIKAIHEFWPVAKLAAWYQGLNAYVSGSCAEGFGLMPLQAMACGAPFIGAKFSGQAEYLNVGENPVGWTVDYELAPPDKNFYEGMGLWGRPKQESLVERMRQAYENPWECERRGKLAAEFAKQLTWQNTALGVVEILKKVGMLA